MPASSYTSMLDKIQFTGPHIRKDKNRGSSRFNISKNREIQKLPLLKGLGRVSHPDPILPCVTQPIVVYMNVYIVCIACGYGYV